jgi:hypothetical protein
MCRRAETPWPSGIEIKPRTLQPAQPRLTQFSAMGWISLARDTTGERYYHAELYRLQVNCRRFHRTTRRRRNVPMIPFARKNFHARSFFGTVDLTG